MQQQQSPSFIEPPKSFGKWLTRGVSAVSFSAEVFLRRGFGCRYVGLQSALAVPLILAYSALFQTYDVTPLILFLGTYLVMCASARTGALWRQWRKTGAEHSRYSGRPLVLRFFPRLSEVTVKQYVEPLIVIGIGVLLLNSSPPLGGYLLIAGFALSTSTKLADECDRNRAIDMNDAVIEATQRAERFRSLNG